MVGCFFLAQCSGGLSSKVDPKYGVSASPRVVAPGEPVPKGGGVYRVGKPYLVAGRLYVPREDPNYRAEGLASWYGDDFHGRLTANGEVYDMGAISAAHPTLPLPSYARVTNLRNGRSIVVRVNDRGPFHNDRVIDLSAQTAKLLDFHDHGLARVRVEYVGPAPLEGTADRMLIATLRKHGPAPAPSSVMLASAERTAPRLSHPLWRSGTPVPVPQGRPFSRDSEVGDIEEEAPKRGGRIAARSGARPSATELTAAARIERTLGPGPAMASVADPAAAPSAGVLGARAPVTAYAPPSRTAGPALMSGRGLY